MDFVWAATQMPPKAVIPSSMGYKKVRLQPVPARAVIPVVISVTPHMTYITGPRGANTFLMTPWKTEKRMIYPPSFVMDSNPFIIEAVSYTHLDVYKRQP